MRVVDTYHVDNLFYYRFDRIEVKVDHKMKVEKEIKDFIFNNQCFYEEKMKSLIQKN